MPKLDPRAVLAVILAGVAMPAIAAPQAAFHVAAGGDTAIADPAAEAAPMRLADNDDDDDGWRRKGEGRDRHDGHDGGRRGGRHHDDDDDGGDDDDGDDRATAPRRIGPAPAQNPLIGAPRANTN